MGSRIVGMVEELTGRHVVNHQSQVVFDPELVLEVFVLDDVLAEEQIAETAHAQLEDRTAGEVRGDDVDVEESVPDGGT
jgi:hypothetical protein